MRSPAINVVGTAQHVLGMSLFGFVVDDASFVPRPGRVVPKKPYDNRSVVDILADVGKTPKEIRQLMLEAAEAMANWCQTSREHPGTAKHRIRDAALDVLKGRRLSGASPKRTADKIVSKLMKDYEPEYWRRVKERRREAERNGIGGGREGFSERRATRLKNKWEKKRRGRGR